MIARDFIMSKDKLRKKFNNSKERIKMEMDYNDASSPCVFGVNGTEKEPLVFFDITHLCNMNCKHCCVKAESIGEGGLHKEKIKEIVDELKENGVSSMYITGGEPTYLPFFDEIIEYIFMKGFDIYLATNGLDLIRHIVLIKKYIKSVFVSLDGLEDVHDEFRGVNGSFNKIINSIEILVENRVPVRISTMLWKKNIKDLEKFVQFIKTLGVNHLHFSWLFNSGRTSENDILLNLKDYPFIVKRIHDIIINYSEDSFMISSRRDKCLTANSKRCYAGDKVLFIDNQGFFYPCPWVAKKEFKIKYEKQWQKGNMNDCFNEIKKMQELVEKRIKKYGYSGCPAMALEHQNDEMGVDPLNYYLQE